MAQNCCPWPPVRGPSIIPFHPRTNHMTLKRLWNCLIMWFYKMYQQTQIATITCSKAAWATKRLWIVPWRECQPSVSTNNQSWLAERVAHLWCMLKKCTAWWALRRQMCPSPACCKVLPHSHCQRGVGLGTQARESWGVGGNSDDNSSLTSQLHHSIALFLEWTFKVKFFLECMQKY